MTITPEVEFICKSIVELFQPLKIILFGMKHNSSMEEITDIDICIIANFDSNEHKSESIKKAYISIDSNIPFDIFLYTPSEWELLIEDSGSFASRIVRKGYIYYEQK